MSASSHSDRAMRLDHADRLKAATSRQARAARAIERLEERGRLVTRIDRAELKAATDKLNAIIERTPPTLNTDRDNS